MEPAAGAACDDCDGADEGIKLRGGGATAVPFDALGAAEDFAATAEVLLCCIPWAGAAAGLMSLAVRTAAIPLLDAALPLSAALVDE